MAKINRHTPFSGIEKGISKDLRNKPLANGSQSTLEANFNQVTIKATALSLLQPGH